MQGIIKPSPGPQTSNTDSKPTHHGDACLQQELRVNLCGHKHGMEVVPDIDWNMKTKTCLGQKDDK